MNDDPTKNPTVVPTSLPADPVLTVRLVIGGLLLQFVVLATVIMLFIKPMRVVGEPPDFPYVSAILSTVALGMIPFSLVVRALVDRSQRTSFDRGQVAPSRWPSSFLASAIAPAAVLEAGALKSLIGYVLEGQTFSVVVSALVAAMLVTLWPAQGSYDQYIRRMTQANTPSDF